MSAARWRAGALAARLVGRLEGSPEAGASRLITDSRAGVRSQDLFVGLVGPSFDGGAFAEGALRDGASIAVVEGERPVPVPEGRAVIRVPDALEALRALARDAREGLRGRVVAITGSNGKTLVKDLLAAALGARASASPMSWNSQVGVPLALIHADPGAEFVLVECGISRPGEMARHADLVRPHLGVFVNVGDAHREGLGERADIAREKARLFVGCERVFAPGDQHLALDALRGVAPAVAVETPAGDDFLAVDQALSRAVARELGVPDAEIDAGFAEWRPAPMRLEVSTTPRGIVLVNDAYTSDPESVEGALAALVREKTPGRAIAVLGGMAQLGSAREAGVARVGRRLVELGVAHLVAVGPGGAEIAAAARKAGPIAIDEVADASEAATRLQELVRSGDRVLLKGSRPDRLERLAAVFFDALAPAVLTVDLDAIVGNFRRIRDAVRPAEVMPVVKASGYGVDGARVAQALQHAGAAHFAVAYPDEGATLRDRGIVRPILVQNVVASEVGKLVEHGLSAQVGHEDQLAALEAEAERQKRAVRVHLEVDTGMGRAGCRPERAGELAARIRASSWLVMDGLMTHFASADDPESDGFTRAQIARFEAARQAVRAAGGDPRWTHAANSAGIARFPEATYDAVRTGIALFGYNRVDERVGLGQEAALRLVTRVIAVRELQAGESVGYGRTWVADRPVRVATVALGYGDGYPWSLSNRGFMRVNGVTCPVVGRVCMDVTLLDVSGAGPVAPGDEVIVFGGRSGDPDLVELAALAGTIPYELLTRLSARVRRVFESSL